MQSHDGMSREAVRGSGNQSDALVAPHSTLSIDGKHAAASIFLLEAHSERAELPGGSIGNRIPGTHIRTTPSSVGGHIGIPVITYQNQSHLSHSQNGHHRLSANLRVSLCSFHS